MKRLDCEYHLRPGEGELQTEIGRGSGPIALGAVPSHGHGPSYGKLLFNAKPTYPQEEAPKPASGPSPPSAISQEVLQQIASARGFRDGDSNFEASFRCYREALAKLPEEARRSLDQHRLAEAETLPASEAVKVYGALLDPLLQSSSTDVTQGGSNR